MYEAVKSSDNTKAPNAYHDYVLSQIKQYDSREGSIATDYLANDMTWLVVSQFSTYAVTIIMGEIKRYFR